MRKPQNYLNTTLTIAIALVWFVNGLYCKVLNQVPRHQQIVSEILGESYSSLFTKIIGTSEILMAIWIVTRIRSRFCAIFQMVIVATMNIMEFMLAPDLLLFGRFNIIFATLFICVIYANEFLLNKSKPDYTTSH